ncbi:hypothetical protein BJAS_P0604 [Bathymodiolus japonicus methanotrophic gill symbiont]|uniref:hypothetical protein n=1 Tax=Bathymodiolus japonicus methanotrophic gill symbiont TaxID=113269 RepID=UPI001B745F1D|nr:hypothetical protein [Bathymodiolus japonicus methanotrophic gill symbiont]GFO71261.1 hypothetical protein BJAS_P0604 [Bathymodiolus japonicus methanotrophic gill symbiont]
MKYIVKSIAVLVLSVASISALAKDKPMNMQPGNASGQGMAMEMSDEMKDKMARKKQIYILKMNDLSDRIQDEKNAKKKQALMDEQLQLIKDHQEKKRQMKMKMMQKHHQKMMQKKGSMKM